MTRFKEMRRIERAIENRDANDLKWARAYCEDRLRWIKLKRGEDRWRRLLKRIMAAQAEE